MKTKNLSKGVDLHLINAPKFKTNIITVYLNIPLSRDAVTKAALLPAILKRGSQKYPTLKEVSRKLDDLYGASVASGVRLKGDGEVLYFSIEYIADKFSESGMTKKAAEFLYEFLFNPYLEDGLFAKEYVRREKINLKNAILSLVNDKREYTEFKCREAMFQKEGYGMFEAGYTEDLPNIDEEVMFDFYKSILKNAKTDIFLSGSVDDASSKTVEDVFSKGFMPRDAKYIETSIADIDESKDKFITEEADVVQSKLCIGMRCGIDPHCEEYPAVVLANCIFGGSAFSKLFVNVREKLSLCYYAAARYAMLKSIMTVSSGIRTEDYDAAYNEIMAQFNDMKNGNIDEFEISSAKKYIRNAYNSINDSLRGMEDYYLTQVMIGSNRSIDELISLIENVTKDQLVRAMGKIKTDVVYFLKGTLKE